MDTETGFRDKQDELKDSTERIIAESTEALEGDLDLQDLAFELGRLEEESEALYWEIDLFGREAEDSDVRGVSELSDEARKLGHELIDATPDFAVILAQSIEEEVGLDSVDLGKPEDLTREDYDKCVTGRELALEFLKNPKINPAILRYVFELAADLSLVFRGEGGEVYMVSDSFDRPQGRRADFEENPDVAKRYADVLLAAAAHPELDTEEASSPLSRLINEEKNNGLLTATGRKEYYEGKIQGYRRDAEEYREEQDREARRRYGIE